MNELARKKEKRKEKFSIITVFTSDSVVVCFMWKKNSDYLQL